MAIITVSRQKGSLGDEIAKAVAAKLKYQFVDKVKIGDALASQGFRELEFEKFDGKKPTVWQSLSDQKKKFIYLLRAAIYDFAKGGNVIILGRGGQALLKDIPGTLKVRIVAPVKNRIQYLMDQEGFDKNQCERLIVVNDRDSSGFIRSFFDIDWDDENMYDLVLNTRTMSVDTATSLILEAVNSPEFQYRSEKVKKMLADKALEQRINEVLVGFPGIVLERIEVVQGAVSLAGLARFKDEIETCRKAVSSIEGVEDVHMNMNLFPLTV
ncbi:MAG: hypothetical protein CR984_00590 [Proteobacteria bacterium]|nr:MAG: hypothetical protein CR984_00590 [Pseudomonadota bacterium]PIE68174.1 MAG: hypothetical protein CSA23_00385 [Deltaproteobacteria bacterium]